MSQISLAWTTTSSLLEVLYSSASFSHLALIWFQGGTAGNVVANRLTENPKFSVLVLEAGVTSVSLSMFTQILTLFIARNEGVIAVDVPFLLGRLGAYDWSAFCAKFACFLSLT
jgi:hypothetical protein